MRPWFALLVLLAPVQDDPSRREAEIDWKGEKIPLTVLLPKDYDKAKTWPVVFTLPPGPGDANMVTWNLENYWQAEGHRRGWIVVAPRVMGRRLQGGGRAFADAVFAWMDKEVSWDKSRVVVSGCSNGGIGTFHLLAEAGSSFAGAIVLPGGYAGKAEALKSLEGKPVWMMVGANDKIWVALSESTKKLLDEVKAKASLEVLEGKDHVFPVDPTSLYDWLDKVPKLTAK